MVSYMWKLFFSLPRRQRKLRCRTDWSQRLDGAVLNKLLCFIVVIPFQLVWNFARLLLRKGKKKLHYNFCCLIYSDALQSLDNITFYLLQTLNGHGYRCLGNEKKCNHYSVFSHFYFTILCLINLKITFYCIWLYRYLYIIYIYLHKYIYMM